jgi:hypothetical protein
MNKEDLRVGMRVELHPATDQWMQGDRYGEITHIFDGYARVKLDKSGRSYNVQFYNILKEV